MALASTPNDELVRAALRKRGTPYVWGGASRGGFDCSGFVCYIFGQMHGMKLPHSASAQSRLGSAVAKDELKAGDLVFFSTYRPGVSHVGIYVGDNKFVHAANSRRGTRVDSISGYYGNRYKWARRLTPTPIKFTPRDLAQLDQDRSEIPQESP